jgi:hypothetical protein
LRRSRIFPRPGAFAAAEISGGNLDQPIRITVAVTGVGAADQAKMLFGRTDKNGTGAISEGDLVSAMTKNLRPVAA